MTEKEPTNVKQKAEKLNSDIYIDDSALLNQTLVERSLTSRKEGLHVWANVYRGLSDLEKNDCKYSFGNFCLNTYGKNPEKLKKTTVAYCQACLKAQSIAREDLEAKNESAKLEHEFFDLSGVSEENRLHPVNKWLRAMEFIDNLNLEIEELKKPVENYLEEISKLETELKKAQSLKKTLENENASLTQQLEASKKKVIQNATYQQNLWLTSELQQANQKIAKLEASFQGVIVR